MDDEIELAVQVNGKLRDRIRANKDASREEIESIARNSPKAAEWTAGQTIRKVVVVPGKIVNFVVG